MSNYKALRIEKEMELEFDSKNPSELKILMDSCYFEHPLITKRDPSEYCEVLVTDCQNPTWWYNDLIGFKFFCQIRYVSGTNKQIISDFTGVKLTKNKRIIFRGFDPKDVMIL